MMELADHFLSKRAFWEHHQWYEADFEVPEEDLIYLPEPILFRNQKDCVCFEITSDRKINSSYYIGADWLVEREKAVYVQSKINRDSNHQINYLAMLFQALKHPDIFEYTKDLFEIKWDKPEIKINQQQDLLTPLLIIQFLQILKSIVRKGLKKSYCKVEHNLNGRIKGKILTSKNIKQNLVKGKNLDTFCTYDEFGFDGIENRILKKALSFVERYLPTHKNLGSESYFRETFNYIHPAFSHVSENASIRDCQNLKINPLYKEYKLAIELAKQILRRFGYNISNTSTVDISTPPFWIDMSKLFELYVLGLLKESFTRSDEIDFQRSTYGNKLDYTIKTSDYKMVADAKYKLKYQSGVNHNDMRQVSGYARLESVYKWLEKDRNEVVDCLIIYPEGSLEVGEKEAIDFKNRTKIDAYVSMYKYGVKLPIIV